LELAEGVELLRKQGENQGVKSMEAELRAVVERCKGHALALTLLASLLRNRSLSLNTFLQDPTFFPLLIGDMASLLNHIYTQQLDQLHRDLLLAFSVYREAVPLNAAQAVINYSTEVPRIQVHTALNTLLIQHLLEASDEERYQLHPIVASFVQDHFVEDDKLANQQALRAAHVRAAQYYRVQATISTLPLEQRKRRSDVRSLIEAAWQLCHAALWQEAYDLMVREHLFVNLIHWGEAAILLELCQLLLPLDKWNPDQSQEALIYNYLGAVYVTLEQVEGGWRYCQDALKISREIEDRKGEGMALDNLGTLYYMAGQKDQALEHYKQALAIREEIGDLDEIGMTLKDLGEVYNSLGRPERALDYYEQALKILREVGDRRGEGTTLNNLGQAYNNLRQKERVLDYYEQALEIRREVGDRRGEGTTLNNIALLYDELGQMDKAIAYYKQGLKCFREIGDREGEGKTLLNIGSLYFKWHRYDVALACFQPDIFGGLQKSPSRDSNEWLDAVKSKVGKKRFDGLLAKVEAQAFQIVEQALNTSLGSNPIFWRWKV
jgi:tetratricopeptide (TPR) repeat protein